MGTRSLVHIKEAGKTLVTLYRQFDGYPTGMGRNIMEALANGKAKLTNGYSMSDTAPEVFNGMGCLAAYLIGALKNPPTLKREKRNPIGNVYVYPVDAEDCGEEFTYILDTPNPKGATGLREVGEIMLTVKASYSGAVLYDGPLKDFDPDKAEENDEDE